MQTDSIHSESGGEENYEDMLDDDRSFHSTRASPGGSVGSAGSSSDLAEAVAQPVAPDPQPPAPGPSQPPAGPPYPPDGPPPSIFRHVSEAPEILDLKRIPSGEMSLHGPQVFGNYGVRGNDVPLKSLATKKTKKSRMTKNSRKTLQGEDLLPPSPPPPPPPPSGPPSQAK